ncbi:MAG: hypothetical protein NTV87_09430 [Ignavibacteriae bacterium]|nr:hypothetical protein [Ignavibacteriota bacterium]
MKYYIYITALLGLFSAFSCNEVTQRSQTCLPSTWHRQAGRKDTEVTEKNNAQK